MSLSLSPPPRKPSTGGGKNSGAAKSLSSPPLSPPVSRRQPRVNTTFAANAMQERHNDNEEEENRAFDIALAKLLGETSLQDDAESFYSSHSTTHSHQSHNYQSTSSGTHDLDRPARPQSIASASSLASSYSGSMNRRVSHATVSSISQGASCAHCGAITTTSPSTVSSSSRITSNTQLPSPISTELEALSPVQRGPASSSVLPCAVCSSARVRSGSVQSGSACSSSCFVEEGEEGLALTVNSLAALNQGIRPHCPHHHHNNPYNNSNNQSSRDVLDIYSTYPYNHRNSLHLYEDQAEPTASLEALKALVPSQVRCRLAFHLDECWLVEFSPSGEYLASAGADNVVMLWGDLMTPCPKVMKSLTMDRVPTDMAWSPNSKYLCINLGRKGEQAGYAKYLVAIVDVETSEIVANIYHPSEAKCATGVGWFPNSDRVVTVSHDGIFCVWNPKGELLEKYEYPEHQIASLSMVKDHEVAMFATTKDEVFVFDMSPNVPHEHRLRRLDNLSSLVGSFAFRRDNIVALSILLDPHLPRKPHVLLYNWQTMTYLRTLEADTYENYKFLIMPSFAGPQEELLVTGSENGLVHVWDVQSGELIQTLEGHSQHVGCVTSNTAEPGMMATCSDDNHIIVWVTKELARKLEQSDQEFVKYQPVTVPVDLKKGW
ncbi:hypothetical protein BGZ73_008570 [Actinomortierella ambigua]|nr:hypothetical protein BGZ73_008570 [Actinomortierella ambigua]